MANSKLVSRLALTMVWCVVSHCAAGDGKCGAGAELEGNQSLEHDRHFGGQILETLLIDSIYNGTLGERSSDESNDEKLARIGETWYKYCPAKRDEPLDSYLYTTRDTSGRAARPIILRYLEDFESFVELRGSGGSLEENLRVFHEEVDASSIYGGRLAYCDAARAFAYRALITGRPFYARDAPSSYRSLWR